MQRMDLKQITRRYEADKLVLLGLFIVGLLIARQLSSSRYGRPRKAGNEVISAIKERGLSDLLDVVGRESFFLVKNARGRVIGFSIDILTDTATSAGIKINVAGHFYLQRKGVREHMMVFEGDNVLAKYSWKTELFGPALRGGSEITLDDSGMLTVGRIDGEGDSHSFRMTSPAIPEFMIDFVLSQMVETGDDHIVVEVITFDGTIEPVSISRVAEDIGDSGDEAEYRFKLELPKENRVSKLMILDDHGRIVMMMMQAEGLILERSSAEVVLRYFPDRAGYILQKRGIPDRDQPVDMGNE